MSNTMLKSRVYGCIERERLIGIVRDSGYEDAGLRSRAVLRGGIKLLEVSLSTPNALALIRELAAEAAEDVFIGAGTVLDSESARMCIEAGAAFIIAPNFSEALIRTCNRYGVPCIPGVGTATEVVTAMELGADAVKLFPAATFGTGFIRALKGPLPQARIIPVGGVDLDNAAEWLAAGAYAVALGAGLTHPKTAEKNREKLSAVIEEHACAVVARVRGAVK